MSSEYTPDLWTVVSMTDEDGERTDKIFGSWYGGYAGSDSWKLSSGITQVVEMANKYEVHNVSGSIYHCYKNNHGVSSYGSSVLNRFIEQAQASNGKFKIEKITINEVRNLNNE